MKYDLLLPKRIVFGWARRNELGPLAGTLGQRVFVITGSRTLMRNGVIEAIDNDLAAAGLGLLGHENISREPEVGDVDRVTEILRQKMKPLPDGGQSGVVVIGLGGGAAIDLAKAVATMTPQSDGDCDRPPTVLDYLEGVGRGFVLNREPLPLIVLPTTAGTGSEATKNAVIASYDPPFKKSLRDDRMMPAIALVDPELTASCPPQVTAASGMDAITQLFESYVAKKSQPMTQALAEQSLVMAFDAIADAVDASIDGERKRSAREKMSHAALLSGICLANAGLGMAHGIAPALGTHCRIGHGLACAMMLPSAIRANAVVCESQYARLARLLLKIGEKTSDASAALQLADHVESLCRGIGIPETLTQLGVKREQIPAIVRDSRGSSMSCNPRELSDDELAEIIGGLLPTQ